MALTSLNFGLHVGSSLLLIASLAKILGQFGLPSAALNLSAQTGQQRGGVVPKD